MIRTKTLGKPLKIVAPRGYPWRFNGPRQSAHEIAIGTYLPFNKVRASLDGVTLFSPADTIGADLIHAFNRIPLNRTPFVIGFESHLPRTFGLENALYKRFLYNALVSRRCRRIVAISHYAADKFRAGLEGAVSADVAEVLLAKLEVRHPNLPVSTAPQPELDIKDGAVVTFVGNHFARKGGYSVLRMAEISLQRGLPIRFNIVSSLQRGGAIWTDPSREGFYERYDSLLSLPNINRLSNVSNAEVTALLAQSHFSVLTTFSDTFGFSALESMAVGTPVIATRQGALPEVIDDGINGILLDPALAPGERGWLWAYEKRGTPEFETLFSDNIERLAEQSIGRIEALLGNATGYTSMRRAAHQKALQNFGSDAAQHYWDNLYRDCVDQKAHSPNQRPAADLRIAGE